MGRSISKGPYIAYHLLNKVKKLIVISLVFLTFTYIENPLVFVDLKLGITSNNHSQQYFCCLEHLGVMGVPTAPSWYNN